MYIVLDEFNTKSLVYYINYPKNVPFTIDGKTGEIKVKNQFSKICWFFNKGFIKQQLPKDISQTATSQGYFPRIFPKWKLPNSAISQVFSKTLFIETQTVAQLKGGALQNRKNEWLILILRGKNLERFVHHLL